MFFYLSACTKNKVFPSSILTKRKFLTWVYESEVCLIDIGVTDTDSLLLKRFKKLTIVIKLTSPFCFLTHNVYQFFYTVVQIATSCHN